MHLNATCHPERSGAKSKDLFSTITNIAINSKDCGYPRQILRLRSSTNSAQDDSRGLVLCEH